MSELQIGLIGLGAAGIVGVMAYNTWQEYRQRKLAEKLFNAAHADVLLDESTARAEAAAVDAPRDSDAPAAPLVERHGDRLREERREPVLHAALESAEAERREPLAQTQDAEVEINADMRMEVSAPPANVSETRVEKTEKSEKAERPDTDPQHLITPMIDYVVALEAGEGKAASEILTAQQTELIAVGKALHWIGYNENSREWEAISEEGEREYRRLRVGLQLVNRRGPVAASELAIFHDAMEKLAQEWTAVADLPPCPLALDAATRLDAFCASVDIQIGINVVAGAVVFPGTKLRALAESAGMVIDAAGRFVRCDDEGNVLYILANQEAPGFSVEAMKTLSTRGVTFLLDVPRVAHGERVFSQMVDLAKRFADVLRGALVDDNRRPLSEGALEPIRRQIAQYQTQMLAQNIPAGGALAQRLFS